MSVRATKVLHSFFRNYILVTLIYVYIYISIARISILLFNEKMYKFRCRSNNTKYIYFKCYCFHERVRGPVGRRFCVRLQLIGLSAELRAIEPSRRLANACSRILWGGLVFLIISFSLLFSYRDSASVIISGQWLL